VTYTDQVKETRKNTKNYARRAFLASAAPEDDGDDDADLSKKAAVLGTIVGAGQQIVSTLTSSHLGKQLDVAPPLVDPGIMSRSGIDKATEYQRPYRVAAQAFAGGATREEAVGKGLQRLNSLAGVDIQMAKVRQSQAVLRAAGRKTYRRETSGDNTCELCEIASDQVYYTEDLMPIHDNCNCEVVEDDTGGSQAEADKDFEPPEVDDDSLQKAAITALNDSGADPKDYRDLIAVREHGEIGPMLTWKSQSFMGPSDLPKPRPAFKEPPMAFKRDGTPLMSSGHGRGGFRYQLTAEQADQQNAAARAGVRRVAAEKRAIKGTEEPNYAMFVNPDSPYAAPVPTRSEMATMVSERTGVNVSFRGDIDQQSAWHTSRALDDLMTKYPHVNLGDVEVNPLWSGNASAYATTLAGTGSTANDTTMQLNSMYFKNHADIESKYLANIDSGYHNPMDGKTSEYAIVTHEFGHSLDATGSYRASSQAKEELVQLYDRLNPEYAGIRTAFTEEQFQYWLEDQLSGYSFIGETFNPTEALAEAFAHVEIEPETASAAEKMLHDLLVSQSTEPKQAMYQPRWITAASRGGSPSDVVEAKEKVRKKPREGAGGPFTAPHELKKETVDTWPAKLPRDRDLTDYLDHDKMVENILARYGDTMEGDNAWIHGAGMTWYDDANAWMRNLLAESGRDWTEEQASAVIACFSRNSPWSINMVNAENFFRGYPINPDVPGYSDALRVLAAKDPIAELESPRHHKEFNFAHAILGDDPNAVAIDRWAARIALGTDDTVMAGSLSGRKGGYEAMKRAYQVAAKLKGISPAQMQAITWVHAVPPDADVKWFMQTGERDWDLEHHVNRSFEQTVFESRTKGGITIDVGGHQPTKGYAYAPSKGTEVFMPYEDMTVDDVDKYIDDHWDTLSEKGNHVGLWDGGDGNYYLDVSRVGEANAETIAAAQANDQLGVYDLSQPDYERGNIDIGTNDPEGHYVKLGEAPDLHDRHQREIQGAGESRSAASLSGPPGGAEKVEKEPPLEPGMVRLYRGTSRNNADMALTKGFHARYGDPELTWFTTDRERADEYGLQVISVDIPKGSLKDYHDIDNDYIVPNADLRGMPIRKVAK